MSDLLPNLELASLKPALLWLPAFSLILVVDGFVAAWCRPLGAGRWLLAGVLLLSPLMLPPMNPQVNRVWWVLDTMVTTFAIAGAARLPPHDRLLSSGKPPHAELFLWMMLPMARFRPSSEQRRKANRANAPRFLLSAAAKRLAWEPIAWSISVLPAEEAHWLLKSAFLMLYFVLNITAASDFMTAFCLALGFDVDPIFNAPLLSKSPRDFWSSRWNQFISRFALREVALPLGRRWGSGSIFLTVFATSGVFHEYFAWGVGSGEARYGVMTAFFLIQGVAVWLGSRVKVPEPPHALGTMLTFVWMMCTAPFFFLAIEPALVAFGYPPAWFPFDLF